jgi:NTE family protein
MRSASPPARIGLVLGAGGPVAHAFHCGILHGLADTTGWDPRTAAVVAGTSAGAQVAALLRAGIGAADLAARVTGDALTPAGAQLVRHYVRPSHGEPHPDHPRRFLPAAPTCLAHGITRPWRWRLDALIAAALPPGRVSLQPQADGFRHLFNDRWPAAPLWIPALCLDTGELVVLGRRGAPPTDVGTAVIASGAVPAVCVPVEIDGKRYVDGGLLSPTHADLLDDIGLDLVLVSSPLSCLALMRFLLRRELRYLRHCGVAVAAIEPSASVRRAMGWNVMDTERGPAVARAARESIAELLQQKEQRAQLEPLFT